MFANTLKLLAKLSCFLQVTRRRHADFPVHEQRPLKLFLQIIEDSGVTVSDKKILETMDSDKCHCYKAIDHRRWNGNTTWWQRSSCTFLLKSHLHHSHKSTKVHRFPGKNPTAANHKSRPGIRQKKSRSRGGLPVVYHWTTRRLLQHERRPRNIRSCSCLKGRLKEVHRHQVLDQQPLRFGSPSWRGQRG